MRCFWKAKMGRNLLLCRGFNMLSETIGSGRWLPARPIKGECFEDLNVTFTEAKKKGEPKGEEKTLPVSDTVKVVKGEFNQDTRKLEAGDDIAHGLKNEMFEKIDEKGMRATIITDDDNKKITEIR